MVHLVKGISGRPLLGGLGVMVFGTCVVIIKPLLYFLQYIVSPRTIDS